MDDFKNLDNAQNVEIIANIFANNKPISELKSDNPQCVILVGAPGVGKTTQTERYLSELGYDYNKFYNISLDAIVEKVKPYRNTTMRVYHALKGKNLNDKNLNDKNFAILNGIYLPTIMSHNTNLSLATTEKKMIKKITNRYTLKNGGGKRKKVNQKSLKNLIELRDIGFMYGVKNGLNIIYDTTLTSRNDKIKQNIMPVIEMSPLKYNITVILVEANEDTIKKRLKERQSKMLIKEKPYIRAINPRAVKIHINENRIGYANAKEYFEKGKYQKNIPDTKYTIDDFKFIQIENLNV